MATRKTTSDGLKLLDKWYFEGNPEMQALLDEERKNAAIARRIYDLRDEAGLTQRQLAKLANTTASVICQLEDADYEGHSLSMLRRIAAALGHTVEVRFEPASSSRLKAAGRIKARKGRLGGTVTAKRATKRKAQGRSRAKKAG